MGTDFLVLVSCPNCRLLPELRCLFRSLARRLATELVFVAVILACAVGGLYYLPAIAFGFAVHGFWDIAHGLFGSSLFGLPMTEIPLGYGMFCLTFDLTVAGYLMMSDTAWDEPGKFDLYFWRDYFWRNRP